MKCRELNQLFDHVGGPMVSSEWTKASKMGSADACVKSSISFNLIDEFAVKCKKNDCLCLMMATTFGSYYS